MGHRELIEALRKEGEEKVRSIRQEAEAEAEKIRKEMTGRIEQIRAHYCRTHAAAVKRLREVILSEAAGKAKTILLTAEKELSDRLYSLALNSLSLLREQGYADIFDALVRELPHYRWEVVRVNPEDAKTAKRYFPDAEIIPDDTIIGGIDVMEKDGKVRVINTLEKRLENGWIGILSSLIRDIYRNGTP